MVITIFSEKSGAVLTAEGGRQVGMNPFTMNGCCRRELLSSSPLLGTSNVPLLRGSNLRMLMRKSLASNERVSGRRN